jgi:hypothetical protein
MTNEIPRRTALNVIAATVVGEASRSTMAAATAAPTNASDPWSPTHDRVWLVGDFWANPMDDWQITDETANPDVFSRRKPNPALEFSSNHRLPPNVCRL